MTIEPSLNSNNGVGIPPLCRPNPLTSLTVIPLHSSRPKSFLNLVELERFDSSLDLFHNLLASSEQRG